jgi:hypothetical protein
MNFQYKEHWQNYESRQGFHRSRDTIYQSEQKECFSPMRAAKAEIGSYVDHTNHQSELDVSGQWQQRRLQLASMYRSHQSEQS